MGTNLLFMLLLLLLVTLHSVCCTTDTGTTIQISRKEFERLKDAVSNLQQFAADQTTLNKQLLDATRELKEENLKISAENLQRKKENENLVAENEKLKADNLVLKADLQEMNVDFKKLQPEVDSQRTVLQDIIASISDKGQEKKQYEEKTHSQNQAFLLPGEHIRRNIHAKSSLHKRHTESTVAFFARISQQYEDHLGAHQNIIFEDVVTNYGNGYNNHQGVFIAPVSGLYLVSTSILSRQNSEFWAAMTVNGTQIVRMNGRGTDGRHGTGMQTIIMALKKGDDVSIQNIHNDDSFWGDRYCSFSGFLIEEFETDPTSIIG